MIKTAMVWVLIFTGQHPRTMGEFPTHGACVQAKYDYAQSDKRLQRKLVCRQQKRIIAQD
mgnify:CR=1 FL=1